MPDALLNAEGWEAIANIRLKYLLQIEAENERLRAALHELIRLGEEGMRPDYNEWLTFHEKVAQIARKVLSVET